MTQDIQEYIKRSEAAGMNVSQIQQALRGVGWPEEAIQQALHPSAQLSAAPIPAPTNPQKFSKFAASKMIVLASWRVLVQDKEMLLFPFISAAVCLVVLGFAAAFYFFVMGGTLSAISDPQPSRQGSDPILMLHVLFIYFAFFFVTTFFQAGVVSIARGRLSGQDLTFADGMKNAMRHIGKIFLWSLLSASVGVLLQTIAERSKLLGKIIAWILGTLWSILSFFVVPILIIEEAPVFDSLKRSAAIIKKTWGEIIIINIGVGFFFMILGMLGVVTFVLTLLTGNLAIIATAGALFILFIIGLSVISATLDTIFKVVLYQFASTGTVPEGFSPELLQHVFKAKK